MYCSKCEEVTIHEQIAEDRLEKLRFKIKKFRCTECEFTKWIVEDYK